MHNFIDYITHSTIITYSVFFIITAQTACVVTVTSAEIRLKPQLRCFQRPHQRMYIYSSQIINQKINKNEE